MTKGLAALLSLALPLPSSAALFVPQAPPAPELKGGPAGGWRPAEPDDEPGDANPGAPEREGFWDRLQDKAFDQLCKNIKLRGGQRFALDGYGGAGARVERYLARTAPGTFALVDRAELSLDGSYGVGALELPEGAVTVSFGASVRGESLVVRPLGTKKSCGELGRLVNVFDLKPALPLSPERVAAMQVGEIWKLPITWHVGLGAGAALSEFPAAISIGRGKESRASVTLYRLREDALRFRLRLDKADVRHYGGQAVYSFPGAALGLPELEIVLVEQLVKLVNRQLARSVSRYLTARFALARGRRAGRQILLEFVLDPRDAESVTALRRLIQGDLNALSLLLELAGRAGRIIVKEPDARREVERVLEGHSGALKQPPTFVGANDYERNNGSLGIKIPILVDYDRVSGRERDHMTLLDEWGGEFESHRADLRNETGLFDVPFLGEMVKHNTQRTAQAIAYRDKLGNASEPVAVFVRQEGFLRSGASVARGMAEAADEISALIGTRGEGRNAATRLPVEELFPEDSLYEPEAEDPFRRDSSPGGPREKTYRRGVSAFTLVFNRKAVADILAAPAAVVLKAYANALGSGYRELMRKTLPHAKLREDGRLEIDEREAGRALGIWSPHDEEGRETLSTLRALAREFTGIVRDLESARQAPTPEARAEAFLKVLAGDGESGLEYEEIVKVLVQLADPADIAGEFFVRVDKGIKGEKDATARLLLNDRVIDGGLVAEASLARSRFAEPSVLTD